MGPAPTNASTDASAASEPGAAAGGPSAAGLLLLGSVCSFLAVVEAIRRIRADLLLDAEPSWGLARLVLGLAVAAIGAAAGVLVVAAAHRLIPRLGPGLAGLTFSGPALVALAAGSILAGFLARLALLSEIPWPMWVDDLSLLEPTLALQRSWSDFLPPVRAVPYVPGKVGGTVGVLYLHFYRAGLDLFGTTVFGVRFPSLLGGVASLFTAAWLGRRLLPRGGGALVALILAGLRWSLIESRWGWNTIVLAPVLDVAAILLLRAIRRERPGPRSPPARSPGWPPTSTWRRGWGRRGSDSSPSGPFSAPVTFASACGAARSTASAFSPWPGRCSCVRVRNPSGRATSRGRIPFPTGGRWTAGARSFPC